MSDSATRSGNRRRLPVALRVGAALLSVFVGMALVSLVWTPSSSEGIDVAARLAPPGSEGHILGTDRLGRDVLTQIMSGARNSLMVSVVATLAALIPGLALGLLVVAGSSRWQFVMSRVVDLGVALPGILVALVLATAIGPGNVAAMAAIAVWFVPILARLMIGPARQILAYDYVEAAYAYGRSRWFVLMRHVLPNIRSLIIVQVTIMFSLAINVEAALSYLGVGAQRPTPSWGRMLYEGQPFIQDAPHLMIYPGLAITLTVLAYNLVGDGMRTWFDPQQKAKAVAR